MKKKFLSTLLAASMTASVLAGCGSSNAAKETTAAATEAAKETTAAATEAAKETTAAATEAAAEMEDKVVVYTAHPDALLDMVIEGFTEETGIEVECLNVGGDLAQRVRSEKENPQADVIYGQDTATYMALKEEGCLAPTTPSWAGELGDFFKDAEGYWYGTIKTPVMMKN